MRRSVQAASENDRYSRFFISINKRTFNRRAKFAECPAIMKYLICESPGNLLIREGEFPQRRPSEAIVKIHKVGICGTDLHAYLGNQAYFTYPRVLGHELAGEVTEIGENAGNIRVGDKVVVIPYISCGGCVACQAGKTNCCRSLQVLGVHCDGGMKEYISLPVSLLLPVPDVSYEQMAITEPLAIAAHAILRSGLGPGKMVLVVGCGPIGIALIRLAHLAGATVIAVDRNAQRLEYARSQAGADHIISADTDVVAEVSKITSNEMAPYVFDATGQKSAMEHAISYMAHGGILILVGLYKGDLMFRHPDIHAKEATILCSRNATRTDFEYVLNVIDQFPTNSYITHQVPYTEMISQFENWTKPEYGVLKAMISF